MRRVVSRWSLVVSAVEKIKNTPQTLSAKVGRMQYEGGSYGFEKDRIKVSA